MQEAIEAITSGSIFKYVMPSTLHNIYENCGEVQVGISKAWILETIQGSDEAGMKDNNESSPISIDRKEKGNVSKYQHLTELKIW